MKNTKNEVKTKYQKMKTTEVKISNVEINSNDDVKSNAELT